jgi:hypothetical protein
MAASCRPVTQPSVRLTRAETLGGLEIVEGHLVLADLGEVTVEPVATPSQGWVDAGGEHQMDLRGQEVDEPAKVRYQCGVGQLVEVVDHDDHLGQLGHLGGQRLEEGEPDATSVKGHELGQLGELRIDVAQPDEQPPGETNRIVVEGGELQPDELDVGVARRPLSQEHRLAGTGRGDDQRQRTTEPLVQSAPQAGTVDGVSRSGDLIGHRFRPSALALSQKCGT